MAKGVPKAIESYKIKLYVLLRKELKNGPRRLDYEELARQIGCARSTVANNVGKLMKAGLIGSRRGINGDELFLINKGAKHGKEERKKVERI